MSGEPAPNRGRLAAILALRCPRCFAGPLFSKPFTMARACPACSLDYGYEQGYLFGGLFISLPVGLLVLLVSGLLMWGLRLSPLTICIVFVLELKLSMLASYHWVRALYVHLEYLGGRYD